MAIVARHNYRGTGQLWLIVPMMALWANLHGGFIIGIAALGVLPSWWAAQDLIACKGLKRTARFGLLTAAAALATMMTPFGIDTWNPVIHALRNATTPTAIAGWQPLIRAITGQ